MTNGRVGFKDLYEAIGKLDIRIDEHFHSLRAEMNGRLRSLERWRSYLTGALAMLTFGVGIALSLLR